MGGRARSATPKAKPKSKAKARPKKTFTPHKVTTVAPSDPRLLEFGYAALKAPPLPESAGAKRTSKATAARTGTSLYTPMVDTVVKRLSLLGRDNVEIMTTLGISETTFYAWLQMHETMAEALEAGRETIQAKVVASLYERAIGYSHPEEVVKWNKEVGFATYTTVKQYPPDTAAIEFVLTNRLGGQWKKKTDGTLDINLTIRRALLELADGDDA